MALNMCNLGDKLVLVTGAGTGIGQGIAIALADMGADVALHYSRSAGRRAARLSADHALWAAARSPFRVICRWSASAGVWSMRPRPSWAVSTGW